MCKCKERHQSLIQVLWLKCLQTVFAKATSSSKKAPTAMNKPQLPRMSLLGNRPRDEKELYALAVSLDALRSGDIEKVADLLAGRYLAVETSAFEGSWETARWLEVARLEERGAAPAEVLLAARRHQKTLDRASGRGSFGRGSDGYWGAGHGGSGHWDDWAPTGRGKGKKGKYGKGKGKKGKAGKKGRDANWWDSHGHEVEKDGENKKGDAAK